LAVVETFDLEEAAARAGLSPAELTHLVTLGVITPDAAGRFGARHLRRVSMVRSLIAAGIDVDGLAAAIQRGAVSLDFLDAPAFDRFSALGKATFREVADARGIPVEMLLSVREAAGSPAASPTGGSRRPNPRSGRTRSSSRPCAPGSRSNRSSARSSAIG
jgi:hypothetical protein